MMTLKQIDKVTRYGMRVLNKNLVMASILGMTFQQQDAVLRAKAKRRKLRLIKNRSFPDHWNLFDTPKPPHFLYAHRVGYGTYNELLKFFEGIEYARRNP